MPNPSGTPITLSNTSPAWRITMAGDRVSYGVDLEPFDRSEFSHERLRQAKNTDGSSPVFIQLFGGKVAQLMSTCGSANTVRPVTPDDTVITSIKRRWNIKRYTLTGQANLDSLSHHLLPLAQSHRIALGRFQAHLAEVSSDVSYSRLLTLQTETFSYLTTTTLSMYGPSISPIGKLSVLAGVGATSLTVTNVGDYRVGQYVIIDAGGVPEEVVLISDVPSPYGTAPAGTITVSATVNAHAIGAIVQLIERNLLISSFTPEVTREIPSADGVSRIRKGWELILESRINQAASSP